MIWIKGRTTGKSLLKRLQALSEEDLNKNILIVEGRHIYHPYSIERAEDMDYPEFKGNLILSLAVVNLKPDTFEVWENTPNPIIKEGKAICPCCGEEVLRSPEVVLTATPYYYYYCSKCVYAKEIQSKEPIPEARVIYPKIPEEYKQQEER